MQQLVQDNGKISYEAGSFPEKGSTVGYRGGQKCATTGKDGGSLKFPTSIREVSISNTDHITRGMMSQILSKYQIFFSPTDVVRVRTEYVFAFLQAR